MTAGAGVLRDGGSDRRSTTCRGQAFADQPGVNLAAVIGLS
jgi:hypothetical protein